MGSSALRVRGFSNLRISCLRMCNFRFACLRLSNLGCSGSTRSGLRSSCRLELFTKLPTAPAIEIFLAGLCISGACCRGFLLLRACQEGGVLGNVTSELFRLDWWWHAVQGICLVFKVTLRRMKIRPCNRVRHCVMHAVLLGRTARARSVGSSSLHRSEGLQPGAKIVC